MPRSPQAWARRVFEEQNPVFERYRNEKSRKQFSKLIYYLKTNNYITAHNLKGKSGIILTKKGMEKVAKASFKMSEGRFKKREDGRWIMIIFDIPRAHPKARQRLRSVLEYLGYELFQQSVWTTPYDVQQKTEDALQYYSLDQYVKIFLIDEVKK